jgi:hypothetical protein
MECFYNKSAVKKARKIRKSQVNLALRHHPFNLKSKTLKEIHSIINSEKEEYGIFGNLLNLSTKIRYDSRHSFEGVRKAEETWRDKKGHCIEQNSLLVNILLSLGIEIHMFIAKNPKGFEVETIQSIGEHLFPVVKSLVNGLKTFFLSCFSV